MSNFTGKSSLDRVAQVLFILSSALIIFGAGMVVTAYRVFPYPIVMKVKNAFAHEFAVPSERLPHYLNYAWYDYDGVRVHEEEAMAPGVTLLTGYWPGLDWKPGIRLMDTRGEVLHEWKTDPAEIWPRSPFTDRVAGSKNRSDNYVHGCVLMDNGDVLFNIEFMGLVRMSAGGEVRWTLKERTHHSIHPDENGNFWVCGMRWMDHTPAGKKRHQQFPGLKRPVAEDFALLVTPKGEVIREISLLKAIYDSPYQKLIWQVYPRNPTGDILHTNDIEPLPSKMADQYPLFEADDLVVSSRFLNSVFVIDTATEKVKWLSNDFVQQHDPDFIGGGIIRVYDNNLDHSANGAFLGGARLVDVRPETGEHTVVYPKEGQPKFYTRHGGKAQLLETGGMLITEARRGRVFEVNRAGKVVWEWVAERHNEELVPEIQQATRYPLTREQVAAWSAE